MLSNLVVTNQKFVFIIDELNQRERIAQKFIAKLLREQGQDETTIKLLTTNGAQLKQATIYDELLNDCGANITNNNNNSTSSANSAITAASDKPTTTTTTKTFNIVLPTLADLLSYQRPSFIFEFLNKLRKCTLVKRIFLWASTPHLHHARAAYILAACEHLADVIVHFETAQELSIITRKPGGSVTNKRYTCAITKNEFLVIATAATTTITTSATIDATSGVATATTPTAADAMGTFKIELDEDEMVARNALKLPYEHTSESETGNIVYTPDAQDDFDEEDPDEDLLI